MGIYPVEYLGQANTQRVDIPCSDLSRQDSGNFSIQGFIQQKGPYLARNLLFIHFFILQNVRRRPLYSSTALAGVELACNNAWQCEKYIGGYRAINGLF